MYVYACYKVVLALLISADSASVHHMCHLEAADRATTAQPAICPGAMERHKQYACNMSTYTIAEGAAYNFTRYAKFLNRMKEKQYRLLFVGDSLSYQMAVSFFCLTEAATGDNAIAYRFAAYHESRLLGTLDKSKYNFSSNPHANPYQMENMVWVDTIIDSGYTHVILNTGAWWCFIFFATRDGAVLDDDQTVDEYADHFKRSSALMTALKRLRKRKVEIIWRDTAPAGICNESEISIGVHFMKGVWEHALPRWREHISPTRDVLHWCNYRPESVPAHWNDLLIRMPLFWEDN